MNVKYQVFVSSTYEDLKQERDQVVKAVLEMGHIPVGMEMFSAADEEQWKIIARHIEESDYYVVLVAHRYGSRDGPISYTEKEYDYAVQCSVPTLGFILEESARWPKNWIDSDPNSIAALTKFKEKVQRKLVSFWSSADDLHGKVSIALMKQMNTNPRVGWVPGSQVAPPEMTAELTRLSRENAELRTRLEQLVVEGIDQKQDERELLIKTLQTNKVSVNLFYENGKDWTKGPEVSLYRIFSILAPELIIEKSTQVSASLLGVILNQKKGKSLRPRWPIPSNVLQRWFADLASLDLVTPSKRKHEVRDTNIYWCLTDKGQDLYSHIRKVRLEAQLETANQVNPRSIQNETTDVVGSTNTSSQSRRNAPPKQNKSRKPPKGTTTS